MKKKILFLLILLSSFFLLAPRANSKTPEELTRKIEELQNKLSELAKTKNTLQNQLIYFDSQISLTEYQIKETQLEIVSLKDQIIVLSKKISVLDLDLNQISAAFLTRVSQSYKLHKKVPVLWFFAGQDLNDSVQKFKYYQTLQLNDRKNLLSMEETRLNYDLQKQKKVEKQAELESLQKKLDQQSKNLVSQKAAKNQLLEITKNDEKNYQKLLTEARSELASLKRFTTSQGGDICLDSPQPQPDGWFWSQRDSRWCSQLIGTSTDSTDIVGAVGCLISSVAMVWQKLGHPINPPSIAQNPSNFVPQTAYMKTPPAPPGYVYERKNYYNPDIIDAEINAGRPVIVHLDLGNRDGHFVVIKSGSNGDYIINDPWYGPDLPINEHYSTANIDSMRLFHP